MVQIKVDIAAKGNFGGKRDKKEIKYLVIHYTANDGDSAAGNANYFKAHIVEASAHYFVDDSGVIQSVPDDSVAYSVGGKKYPSCAKTGGGKRYGSCTNRNSISIELCDTRKNGKYDFSEKTLENAAQLSRLLLKKYNIPVDNIIRHFDVTGKNCPAPFVSDEKAWKAFKERIVDEVKYYEEMKDVPKWAQPLVKDMIQKGCFGDTKALHLSDDMLRTLALMERYNKKG